MYTVAMYAGIVNKVSSLPKEIMQEVSKEKWSNALRVRILPLLFLFFSPDQLSFLSISFSFPFMNFHVIWIDRCIKSKSGKI